MRRLALLSFLIGTLGGCTWLVQYDGGLHITRWDFATPTSERWDYGCIGRTLVPLNIRNAPHPAATIVGQWQPGEMIEIYQFATDLNGNLWSKVNRDADEWSAWYYNGNTYIEAVNDCSVVEGWQP